MVVHVVQWLTGIAGTGLCRFPHVDAWNVYDSKEGKLTLLYNQLDDMLIECYLS